MATMAAVPERHRVTARRRLTERVVVSLLGLATVLGIVLLFLILAHVVISGLPALDLAFFTQRPKPFGEDGGGVEPAILGTLELAAVSGLLAIPIGIAAAIFVVEYRSGRFAAPVRFAAELIAGLPSIVFGLFVFSALVISKVGGTGYAGWKGSVAIGLLMLPVVARSAEVVLMLVPSSLREAALALGAPKWKVILRVVVPTARAGIATAAILAVARSAGETAPLLLTALGNDFFSTDLLRPIDALPLRIYRYALSPYEDWHTKAWGASLVLVTVIGLLSLGLRLALRRGAR